MKTIILFLLYVIITSLAAYSAKPVIRYTYDNAGNRIKRELVIGSNQSPSHNNTTEVIAIDNGKTIKITSNSTNQAIDVLINGYEESDQGQIEIYSIAGETISVNQITDASMTIDTSHLNSGIFILHVFLNGKDTSCKIIKGKQRQ